MVDPVALNLAPKNFQPTKLTQNDMKCHFESFWGCKFGGGGCQFFCNFLVTFKVFDLKKSNVTEKIKSTFFKDTCDFWPDV